MPSAANPTPLWKPDEEFIAEAQITRFQAWASEHYGAPADGGYEALHRWSVTELDTFWKAVADWFDIRFTTPTRACSATVPCPEPSGSPAPP